MAKDINGGERRSRVRHAITIYVDRVEFEPSMELNTVTRTSYDLELTEHDMLVLYEGLKNRIDSHLPKAIRIRITGRLVS